MLTIGRGQHGSTYGGNPIAAKVAIAALQVRAGAAAGQPRLGCTAEGATVSVLPPLCAQPPLPQARASPNPLPLTLALNAGAG